MDYRKGKYLYTSICSLINNSLKPWWISQPYSACRCVASGEQTARLFDLYHKDELAVKSYVYI